MYEYFPGNYVWNLGAVATLNSGGLIDEVDRACRPLRDLAAAGYYAPRAAAFEKRPVPRYWDHVPWVWGYDSPASGPSRATPSRVPLPTG